jgi:hypothetical protein
MEASRMIGDGPEKGAPSGLGNFGHRAKGDGLIRVQDAALDAADICVLSLQRQLFHSFCWPNGRVWSTALTEANQQFGHTDAGAVWEAVLLQVEAMRTTRRSMFTFSNPQCQHCRQVLTGDERHLAYTLRALRRRQPGWAMTHALCLCEGNDPGRYLQAKAMLAGLIECAALRPL